jgi:hypothetical protein
VEPVDGGGSRVTVDTDLRVTGRAATFGRGLMEDVAGRMLGEFAKRLESVISQPAESEPARERLRDVSPSPSPAPAVRLRAPGWAVSFLAGVVVGMLLRRRPDVVVIRER